MYQGHSASGGMINLIDAVGGSGSIVEGKQYLEHVSDKRHADADRAGALKDQLDKQQAALSEKLKAAQDARDEAAQQQDRVQTLSTQQHQAIGAVVAGQNDYQSKLNSLIAQKQLLQSQLSADSAEIAAELARVQSPPYGDGSLIRPIPGGVIVSPFGPRADPFTGQASFHPGVDIAAPCGTWIVAAGIGQVVTASDQGGYGNAILINHGGGLATLYGHQSAFAVRTGDIVAQGQVIGYVGSTGESTGCHLHFEVRINGTPVDPVPYLPPSN